MKSISWPTALVVAVCVSAYVACEIAHVAVPSWLSSVFVVIAGALPALLQKEIVQ